MLVVAVGVVVYGLVDAVSRHVQSLDMSDAA